MQCESVASGPQCTEAPPKPVGTRCALAAGRTSLEKGRKSWRVIDVRNAAHFIFCVRSAAFVRVSPAIFYMFFSSLLLSSTLQAHTNIPEAGAGRESLKMAQRESIRKHGAPQTCPGLYVHAHTHTHVD